MYSQSRESQRSIPEQNHNTTKQVVTADFLVTVLPNFSAERKVVPRKVKCCRKRRTTCREVNSSASDNLDSNAIPTSRMFIRIGVGEQKWKFDADIKWLRSLIAMRTSLPFTLMKGTIHFRLKYFGSWEPFEYIKHFVVETSDSAERLVESIFTVEQLQRTIALYKKKGDSHFKGKCTLEMTFTVERVGFFEAQESLLCAQAVEMNNALIPTPPKSDFRIKVDDEEFFVHLNQIKAFSCVSETLSKYGAKSDWSDLLNPDSMQALLRFIYYCEFDLISNPKIAFDLLRFGHMYQVPALFKICGERLMTFSEDEFTLDDLFHIYMFVRIPDEFQQLKKHFCRILHENAAKYDTTELKQLSKLNEDGTGVDALIEILQFDAGVTDQESDDDEDSDDSSADKRQRLTIEDDFRAKLVECLKSRFNNSSLNIN